MKKLELILLSDEYEILAGCLRKLALLDEPQRIRIVRALDSMLEKPMIHPVERATVAHLEDVQTSGSRGEVFTAQGCEAVDLAIKILSRQVVGND